MRQVGVGEGEAAGTAARVKGRGIRALSKQETQHRIIVAARQLFEELGYERATLREIAARAGVTAGALFNHTTDKRDLIYMIFNEEVDTIVNVALAAPRKYQTFAQKMLTVTEHYFRLFANDPVLSRILLSQVVALSPGGHLDRYLKARARLVDGIEAMVREAQAAGEIISTEPPALIARHLFYTYAASLRNWIAASERPSWREGHRDYESLLNLQMHGLLQTSPKRAATPRATRTSRPAHPEASKATPIPARRKKRA